MDSEDPTRVFSYIARKPCGCLVAATVDRPEYARDVAKDLAAWVRDGLTVERVTVQYVREAKWGCDCDNLPKQEALAV